MREEQWPEDPPRGVEETLGNWRYIPRYLDLHQRVAWTSDGSQAVGRASINIGRYYQNAHMADFDIYVLPGFRRRGIGRGLLTAITEVAEREDRSLLLVSTDAAIPAGRAFVLRLEARAGVESTTSQLEMQNLNTQLVNEWLQKGRRHAASFALGFWESEYPPEYVAEMAEVKHVMNSAPTDNLELEEFGWTVDDLRQEEDSLRRRGIQRWTLHLRHRGSGQIAGFTEVFFHAAHPAILEQGHTAVVPQFRNRGLAQWLKGEMLQRIVAQHPEVKIIRTVNASSNLSMIRINQRLGFRRYKSWTTWQIDLGSVLSYLKGQQSQLTLE